MSECEYQVATVLDELRHGDIQLSQVFSHGATGAYIVDGEALFQEPFTYKRYCQKQNEWMRRYEPVYRFLEGEADLLRFLRGGAGRGTHPPNTVSLRPWIARACWRIRLHWNTALRNASLKRLARRR